MKIPITDQFLWALYNFYESTNKALGLSEVLKVRTWKEIARPCPEFWINLKNKQRKKQFAQFINYLKVRGYIKIHNIKEKKGFLLTPKGQKKALRAQIFIKSSADHFKKRKDGKWLMIIFDIPEKKKRYREEIRKILYALGFKKLQKSVWVCPYDVLSKLDEAIRLYNLDYYVRTFLIEEVEI